MSESSCSRCEKAILKKHKGLCSLCRKELESLKPGDPVEWLHHGGSWRSALFLSLHYDRGTAAVQSPLGTTLYKNLSNLRRSKQAAKDIQ